MTSTRNVAPGGPTRRTAWPHLDARQTDRYGVFVRPDPATCRAQADLHTLLERQYGLIAARVFPPHATLLGNIALAAAEGEFLERVATAVRGFAPIAVHNRGVTRLGQGIAYDIHYRADGGRNQPLTDLAVAVEQKLDPVRSRTDHDYLTGHTTTETFHAHLTLAGQDLALRADLQDEVWDFTNALAPDTPADFTVDTVSVFRFRSDHWASEWWKDMTWQHLRSFHLTT
jgi:2'-5' RNA ligase superfamily